MSTQDDTEAPVAGRVPVLLLVEDDAVTREMLGMALEDKGFSVIRAADVAAMRRVLAVDEVDAAVLDMTLPDGDPLDALMAVPTGVRPPAVCMSSAGSKNLRAEALRRGAEDFVVKPVVESELVERVNKLLARRDPRSAPVVAGGGVLQAGGWILDTAAQRVAGPDGAAVDLTAGEFRLLLALLRNPGRPLSREWLTETAIGRPWRANDRSIDVMVGRLRRKMGLHDGSALQIVSVRYLGYRADVVG